MGVILVVDEIILEILSAPHVYGGDPSCEATN